MGLRFVVAEVTVEPGLQLQWRGSTQWSPPQGIQIHAFAFSGAALRKSTLPQDKAGQNESHRIVIFFRS
jgi:hypothetical protein